MLNEWFYEPEWMDSAWAVIERIENRNYLCSERYWANPNIDYVIYSIQSSGFPPFSFFIWVLFCVPKTRSHD